MKEKVSGQFNKSLFVISRLRSINAYDLASKMTTLTAILLMSPDKTDYKTDRFLQQRSRQRVTSYILQHPCHRQLVIKQDSLKTDINVPLGKFLVIFHFCLHIYIYVCVSWCVCMFVFVCL
jgi:hypothetical protein